MRRSSRQWFGALAGAAALMWASSYSFGGAFEVLQQGARASGQAEAFAAQADDPSAIWYNPAGLTQLKGTNISGGGYLVLPDYHFHGTQGDSSMHQYSFLPHVYAESDFGLEKFRFGLGINNVFGLRESWGQTGPLETLMTRGHLYTINMEPTVAYQITDGLSVGVGMNIYYATLDLEHSQVLGAPPTPRGYLRLHGDDYALGASPGVMWKIDEHNTVAAFYHSAFKLDMDLQASIEARGIPAIGPSPAKAAINIPQIAGFGYAFRPISPWKIEADVVWSNWHSLQQIVIRSPNPVFNNGVITTRYHDSWSFRLGTQYDLTDHWTIRGGYAYGNSAVPASTFSPLVPDSNYHIFSVGIGYKTPVWYVDAAYLYIFRETRNISNSINSPFVDGSWHTDMMGFMVTAGIKL